MIFVAPRGPSVLVRIVLVLDNSFFFLNILYDDSIVLL
jgi:hypothetical protein